MTGKANPQQNIINSDSRRKVLKMIHFIQGIQDGEQAKRMNPQMLR